MTSLQRITWKMIIAMPWMLAVMAVSLAAWGQTPPLSPNPPIPRPTIIETKHPRFAVYYTDKERPETFLPFKTLVFDADHHPALRELQNRGKSLLGYVSVFEAAPYREHYAALEKAGLLIKPDGQKGREYIDIRKPQWAELLVGTILPSMVEKGFDGVMLDTLDDALALEERQPQTYAGMTQAAISTIKLVKLHFPYMKIMVNRAFQILPKVQMDIDMVLAESTLSDARIKEQKPVLFAEDARAHVLSVLKAAKTSVPELEIYTLDYWDMQDKQGVAAIYAQQRALGFIPYVATPDLQTVFDEPQPEENKP